MPHPVLTHPAERVVLARLLRLLAEGERIARDCALAQAGLTAHDGQRRFFLAQSRQERLHAVLFGRIADWLAPRTSSPHPALAPLTAYRTRLEAAVNRGRFLETVLGEQVVLESLGEAVLYRIEAGLVTRGAPFGRLRRLLLEQEEAHAGFGDRVLARAITQGLTSQADLRRLAEPYLALAAETVWSLAGDLATLDEDVHAWVSDVTRHLPCWLSREPVPVTGPMPT